MNICSISEIDKIIKSLKNKTSHGYDEISDKILKASSLYTIPINIYN